MDKPIDLFFDIETSPMLVFAWGLGKQDIDYKRIYKERQVLCIGFAWDTGPVQVLTLDYGKFDLHVRDNDADLEMVKEFSNIINQADRVIGHNAKRFDISVLRSRLIKHQLPDFVPLLVDDTYTQTRGIAFASHKLDYLAPFLGLPPKEDHPYEMWLDVVNHVPGALEKMQFYCKGDVDRTRQVYGRLQPYIKSSLNMAVWNDDEEACPHCGSNLLHVRKYRYTPAGRYPIYQCGNCGKYSNSGKNDLKQSGKYPR